MKPIYLKMKAFGSYKDEFIDFSQVQQGVFLITGDTGAGKTTIFDAITYALYGESSGGKRDSRMMVSQFAGYGEYTEVEFAFSFGENVYKVRRTPEQPKYKEKKDEDGNILYEQLKTTKKPEAELTLPNGEIFIGKLNETNKKIREIIGIDATQFTQIVMLAQGDFLKLLHAKSDERKEIFSKIFDTHFYDAIGKEIENCYKECEGKLKTDEREIESCLSNVVCSRNSKVKEEWEEKGVFSIDRKEEIFRLLEEIIEEYVQLTEENKKKKELCDRKKEELQKAVHDAQIANKDFDALKAAKKRWEKLENQQEEIEEDKKKINEGEKAIKIEGSYIIYSDKRQALEKKQGTVKQLQSKLGKQKELLSPLAERKRQTDIRYEKKYSKKIEEISKLEEKLDLYKEIEELEVLYKTETKDFKKKEKLQQKKEMEETEEKKKADILEKEIEQLTELAGKRDFILGQVEKLSREWEDVEDFLKLLKAEGDYCVQLNKQQKKYEKTKVVWEKAEEDYNEIYRDFISSQAHLLRENLVEGKPCPVCGSVHHMPVMESNTKVVGQKETERAKAVLEKAAKSEQAEKEILQKIVVRKEENGKLLEERRGKLRLQGEMEQVTIEKIEKYMENLAGDLENYHKKKKQAESAVNELAKKQQEKHNNQENIEKIRQEQILLGTEIAGLKISIENREEILLDKKAQLPYPTKEETMNYLSEAKKQQKELASEKKKAEDNYQAVSDEVKTLEATLETEKKGKDDLQEEEKKARENFKEQLTKQGFSSEEKFWGARMADDILDAQKKKVEEYEKVLQETKTNIALLTERTKDKKYMDITRYQKELANVQEEIQVLEKEDKEVYSRKQMNENAKDLIQKKYRDLEENSLQYQVLRSLHETANGKLSKKKMDFQTYIQRHYFKQVIYAANERLKTMSNNQFILQCKKLENLGTQGNVGLDIDVYSLVNDQLRDVKTLSGGESFMAALSMALGLADIIQSKAGKIKIDTMFIDEGFGSLSDDTRNQALGLLQELSQGNRLIGIISHVSELKAQVDTKLVVTKTNQGSKAKWSW